MNAVTPVTASEQHSPWDDAVQAVNAWRGACVQSFAQAEGAVTETLLRLSAVPERGAKIRLRHLIGQRLDDLATAIGADGEFAPEGKSAICALATFRKHETLRTHLCHGSAKVALERNGRWIAIFRYSAIRARQAERNILTVEQEQATQILADLRGNAHKLSSILGAMRHQIDIMG